MQTPAKNIRIIRILLLLFFVNGAVLDVNSQAIVDSIRLMNTLKTLSSEEMAGRFTGTNGISRARLLIQESFESAALQPLADTWLMPFDIDKKKDYPPQGVNIVGKIVGRSDSALVVTAHYDHLGVKKGEVFFGADDNASGVTVLLEAALLFSKNETKPAYTLIFAALDAEETGLLGGYALVDYLKSRGIAVKLNLNMDMVSKGFKNELYVCGTYHYPQLIPLIDTTGSSYAKVVLKLGHDRPEQGQDDWTNSSDHGAFHKQKIPFLYFGVEDHKYYHQPTDTFETTPFSFFLRSGQTIIGFLDKYLYAKR